MAILAGEWSGAVTTGSKQFNFCLPRLRAACRKDFSGSPKISAEAPLTFCAHSFGVMTQVMSERLTVPDSVLHSALYDALICDFSVGKNLSADEAGNGQHLVDMPGEPGIERFRDLPVDVELYLINNVLMRHKFFVALKACRF